MKSNYVDAARGTNELGVRRLGAPERPTSHYANRGHRRSKHRGSITEHLRLRNNNEASIALALPPTVQQAVNSDISVNKHLGRYPFRGRKCDMSLEAWAQAGMRFSVQANGDVII